MKEVLDAIEKYKSKYRRQNLPALELSGWYDLFPEAPSNFNVEASWSPTSPWPHGERAGVYFIFGDEGSLLYVGKASVGCIGARLDSYFGYERATKACRIIEPKAWSHRPRYVAALAVPEDMKFEAAGIEEFMIRELRPPLNTVGLRSLAD